ncbi:MAG: hypothetical protein R3C05_22490 [Pirellulaceae bacterium]
MTVDMKRSNRKKRRLLAAFVAAAFPVADLVQTAHAADEDFHENTLLYEDDAWYDVSEWFDGNDYNPTDEAIGRIDNETYELSEALTSSDIDDDIDWDNSSYGYYDDNDSDWYYDYYDYGYTDYADYNDDGFYDYSADYYDYDYDGIYDSTWEYYDTDEDGIYDDTLYLTYNDAEDKKQTERQSQGQDNMKSKRSEVVSAQGAIKAAKKVKTPTGMNLVIVLTNTQNNQDMIVDLGSAKQFDPLPRVGQDVSVKEQSSRRVTRPSCWPLPSVATTKWSVLTAATASTPEP